MVKLVFARHGLSEWNEKNLLLVGLTLILLSKVLQSEKSW
jgi:bisphosphoglycerate-dependent phosphoglycerate mutase